MGLLNARFSDGNYDADPVSQDDGIFPSDSPPTLLTGYTYTGIFSPASVDWGQEDIHGGDRYDVK
jgi:hypothetical protein